MRRNTLTFVLIATAASAISAPLAANVLVNSSFETVGPLGSSVVVTGFRGQGASAAQSWNIFHNTLGTTTTELIQGGVPNGGSTMLHVVTDGANNGIAQVWGPPGSGPACVTHGVWIFVVSGAVYTGAGNHGQTGADAFSTATGTWEFVQGTNTFCPANAFIIYSANGGADFYVDLANVTETVACPGPPGDINLDGGVNAADLAIVLASWGPCSCPADVNGSGAVDATDLAVLLANWGC
jgi:hypothetical protein